MTSLAKAEVVGTTNPKLVFYSIVNGKLTDLDELSFQIFDVSTDPKKMSPSQVIPSVVGDRQAVNLTTDRLGVGRYAASFTAPTAAMGRYEIRWFYKVDSADPESVARIEFEILDYTAPLGMPIGPTYALVSDMRDEGYTVASYSDARILQALMIASAKIDLYTGRFFSPRYLNLAASGEHARVLLLANPILGLESMSLSGGAVELDNFRVFTDPENSRIEFLYMDNVVGETWVVPSISTLLTTQLFPFGVQNVALVGVFGYSDNRYTGAPWGDVPILIRHATKLIAKDALQSMASSSGGPDVWRVIRERTRDQEVQYSDASSSGQFSGITGDPELDAILVSYMRPPNLGAV